MELGLKHEKRMHSPSKANVPVASIVHGSDAIGGEAMVGTDSMDGVLHPTVLVDGLAESTETAQPHDAGPVASATAIHYEAAVAKAEGKLDDKWKTYETVFTNAKAGMEGVDKEKVKQVVYDMSKGSRFFANEEKKNAATNERIERMRKHADKIGPEELEMYQKVVDKKVAELEATRDLSRIWMHVDMDMFYAAVETLDDPSLATKPMAVGGMGMICTANYEARKFGVRAAMPGFIARKLCAELVFVPPDFEKYTRIAKMVREVLHDYDPNFIARSLDEAYLDLTKCCADRGMKGGAIAEEIRTRVFEKTRLTCSAGVAANRLLAKVCSDMNKPNGQFVLSHDRGAIMDFVSSLAIRKVSGIGKVTEKVLREVLGITTCGQLLEQRAMVYGLFTRISSDFFLAVGLGIGGTEAHEEEHRKSVGIERTFAAISQEGLLVKKLEELATGLAEDMAREELHGRTLTLKLKTTDFETRTRSVTLPSYASTYEEIMRPALKLLKAELPISVRLMGLRFSHFREEIASNVDPCQRTLNNFLRPAKAATESDSTPTKESGRETSTCHRQDSAPQTETPTSPKTSASGGRAPCTAEDSKGIESTEGNGRRDEDWSCEACSLINANFRRACEACGALPNIRRSWGGLVSEGAAHTKREMRVLERRKAGKIGTAQKTLERFLKASEITKPSSTEPHTRQSINTESIPQTAQDIDILKDRVCEEKARALEIGVGIRGGLEVLGELGEIKASLIGDSFGRGGVGGGESGEGLSIGLLGEKGMWLALEDGTGCKCVRCGEEIFDLGEGDVGVWKQEHEDYHFALSLQEDEGPRASVGAKGESEVRGKGGGGGREGGRGSGRGRGKGVGGKGLGKRANEHSIDTFFAKQQRLGF